MDLEFRRWDSINNKFEFLDLCNHAIMTSLPIPSMGKWDHLEPWEQYTGDKDIKEHKIYSGDILLFRDIRFRVIYSGSCFTIEALGSSTAWCGSLIAEIAEEAEIAGHIHE